MSGQPFVVASGTNALLNHHDWAALTDCVLVVRQSATGSLRVRFLDGPNGSLVFTYTVVPSASDCFLSVQGVSAIGTTYPAATTFGDVLLTAVTADIELGLVRVSGA